MICFIRIPLMNEVTFLDIGQGDSIFIRDTSNQTILIDVGGKVTYQGKEEWQKKEVKSNASRTLIPYLKSQGVRKIDSLILTHIDTDHVGDLEEVAQAFKIKTVFVSEGSLTNNNFVVRLKKLNRPVRVLKVGDSISIMSSKLHVLYPNIKGDGRNNDSIVLYGKLLDRYFLFTGDLEKEGELEIMKSYKSVPVDILKLGHHGSKGSSSDEFLDFVSARISIISAGKNNSYHHPHKETLDRLERRGHKVYRTDQNGAIRFKGNNKFTVETVR